MQVMCSPLLPIESPHSKHFVLLFYLEYFPRNVWYSKIVRSSEFRHEFLKIVILYFKFIRIILFGWIIIFPYFYCVDEICPSKTLKNVCMTRCTPCLCLNLLHVMPPHPFSYMFTLSDSNSYMHNLWKIHGGNDALKSHFSLFIFIFSLHTKVKVERLEKCCLVH